MELLVSLISIIITELGEEEIGNPSGIIHLDSSQIRQDKHIKKCVDKSTGGGSLLNQRKQYLAFPIRNVEACSVLIDSDLQYLVST